MVQTTGNAAARALEDGNLSIIDNRTGLAYTIPIQGGSIRASDFLQIKVENVAECGSGTGLVLLDPGYQNTAVVETAITRMDGKKGTLHYRERPLDDLMLNNKWEEVAYLLIWGNMPSENEKRHFRERLAAAMVPPKVVVDAIHAFPKDADTSCLLMAGLAAYASIDDGSNSVRSSGKPFYLGNTSRVDSAIIRCIAYLATTVALTYCHKRNIPFTPADPDGSFIGNVLRMMGFNNTDKRIENCLSKLWILSADHGMTNSTAAFLHAASTLTDPASAMISAVVSAYGPLHGGAVEVAYRDLEEMSRTPNGVQEFLKDVKKGKRRLFGYGHRIYQTVDPRVKWLRTLIEENKDLMGRNPLLQTALEVDRIASEDEYFMSRNLKVNADLYGCFLYTAMGFEKDMLLAMSSLGRIAGVMAHWRESMMAGRACMWRPQQVYTGEDLGPVASKL